MKTTKIYLFLLPPLPSQDEKSERGELQQPPLLRERVNRLID